MREKDLHKEIEEIFLAVYDSVSKFSGDIEEIASTSHQLTTFVEGISSFSAETYNKYYVQNLINTIWVPL